jgi:DNA polymerase (family 10)
MPVQNTRISAVLDQVADLLEIENANPFRTRAYRKAARTIEALHRPVTEMIARGESLDDLPGIGADLAEKITEIAETGTLPLLKQLERGTPPGLPSLMRLEGLGPKRVHILHTALGISDIAGLEKALQRGKLRELKGFGPKTEKRLLKSIALHRGEGRRFKLSQAEQEADAFVQYLKGMPGLTNVAVAGSLRRRRDTIGDIDILASGGISSEIMERFVSYDEVMNVVSHGTTRSTVILRSGLQVDIRVVPAESYGAALLYLTGSKDHNLAVRRMAISRGLKINEYGVFKGARRIAARTESEVYAKVGLPYIEPELREASGEIQAALAGKLPHLVSGDDIRGDLHVHSSASDGAETIAAMAKAAEAAGLDYIAITDHSRHLRIAHGLDADRLSRQIDEIDELNEQLAPFRVLKSCEVDILENGRLDLPDRVLSRLDLVVGAIHYKFELSEEAQTERVIRAMDNPFFTIFSHPTGRLIGERAGYQVNMERLIEAALHRQCYMEINAQPDRLDLSDRDCRLAKEAGLKLAISTDAHRIPDFWYMRYGVDQARRGWLEPRDVLNTLPWPELQKLFRTRAPAVV